jgi:hypothetical protein
MYNAISDQCGLHNMADIFLAAVHRLLLGLLFRKVYLKSDTAVALRRSISLIPFITLVFPSTFMTSISVN